MAGGSDRSRSGSGGGGGGGAKGKEASGDGDGDGVKERIARALRIYKESAAGDGDDDAGVPRERGLPGRVFDVGAPEWTPNVGEYARISYALIYDIQAALVLPILDPTAGDACVAILVAIRAAIRLALWVYAAFLRPGKPLRRRYGAWAVVTGATDGIGRAIAFRLAAAGLGLVLVGRNPEKLAAVATEIKDKHAKVPEVRTFVLDFVGEGLAEGVEACSESDKRN